jgi:hypothetical protein
LWLDLERHWDFAHRQPAVTPLKSVGKLLAFLLANESRSAAAPRSSQAGAPTTGSLDNIQ